MNVLIVVALIVAGLLLVAVVVGRAQRPKAKHAVPADIPAGGIELPAGVEPGALRVRVTSNWVCVYVRAERARFAIDTVMGQEPVKLLAMWRWSSWRRALVPYDGRWYLWHRSFVPNDGSLDWSPAWSRPLAESAWRAR